MNVCITLHQPCTWRNNKILELSDFSKWHSSYCSIIVLLEIVTSSDTSKTIIHSAIVQTQVKTSYWKRKQTICFVRASLLNQGLVKNDLEGCVSR